MAEKIKIYIDQGHNPRNPNSGAEGFGLQEADLTYEIGRLLADILRESSYFDVRLSRNDPNEILGESNAGSLSARVKDANAFGADWFLSLHANASTSPSATGTEGYVYSSGSAAYGLAEDIIEGISANTGIPVRGVFVRPSLYVLRKTRMPAALIELGFITNEREAYLMRDRPDLFADGIASGIFRFFGV